jgi:hypothetical protein
MKHAPAYIAAHDLVVALLRAQPAPGLDRAITAAHDLLESISLALTFPDGRAAHLLRADAALVRARVSLRVVAALGGLGDGHAHRLLDGLLEIGRMIGGWRKELRRQRREGDTQTASSAAGPTARLRSWLRPALGSPVAELT